MRFGRNALVVVLVVAVAGVAYQAIGGLVDARRLSPAGTLIEVGEGRMHIHCTGDGSPTVVLDAGGGGTALVAEESGHMIPLEPSEVVIDAVHGLLDQLRAEQQCLRADHPRATKE